MAHLQVYDPRERALVAAADAVLAAGSAVTGLFRKRRKPQAPRRILLLRLERIGDLVMAMPAIGAVRRLAPEARIDLVVGSWNGELARAMPSVDEVHTLDAAWLARGGAGLGMPALLKSAARWRYRHYDLAINFEPDVRSNLLVAVSGADWTAGYRSGGGGPLLDEALDYDTGAHTTDNALRLVSSVFDRPAPVSATSLLSIPESSRAGARALIGPVTGPVVAMHPSGGRAIKQWDPDRFGEVARRLVETRGATIVLTGTPEEAALLEAVKRVLPPGRCIDASGESSLLTVAAVLAEAQLLVTGDTGPMHLAAAVGTPIVAVFGPSDPRRYAPRGPRDEVVRVDLPCAPCNRIRLPPARCTGHIPDCLVLVSADRVFGAAARILDLCK